MNNIISIYNDLIDQGICIRELYIYDTIRNDESTFGLEDNDLIPMIDNIINLTSLHPNIGLEQIIDDFLSGTEIMEDEDVWGSY